LAPNIASNVPLDFSQVGLPASSVPEFVTAYSLGGSLNDIPEPNATILNAGVKAFKHAYSKLFSSIFSVSMAFSVLAAVCALFWPNAEKITDEVATTLDARHNAGGPDVDFEK
jgi:hypothetical protein